LGGSLPYEEKAWLTLKEVVHYSKLSHPDNQIYAIELIHKKITSGKILDLKSLPPWIPPELVFVIRKCVKVDYKSRFESVSDLMATLNNLWASIPDWRLEPYPVLHRPKGKIRILQSEGRIWIEKMGNSGKWRKQHNLKPSSLEAAVAEANRL